MIEQENVRQEFRSVWDNDVPEFASYVMLLKYKFGKGFYADKSYGGTLKYLVTIAQQNMLERALKRYESYLEKCVGVKPDELIINSKIVNLKTNFDVEFNRFVGVDSVKKKLKEIYMI